MPADLHAAQRSAVAANLLGASLGRRLGPSAAPLCEEALVVLLRGPEDLRVLDLSFDAFEKRRLCLQFGKERLGLCVLSCGVRVDAAAVVGAPVVAHLVAFVHGGSKLGHERLAELWVARLRFIVHNLHRLAVTGAPRADGLVPRPLELTLRVPSGSANYARLALQEQLDAPKAPAGKGGHRVAIVAQHRHFPGERVGSRLRRPRVWHIRAPAQFVVSHRLARPLEEEEDAALRVLGEVHDLAEEQQLHRPVNRVTCQSQLRLQERAYDGDHNAGFPGVYVHNSRHQRARPRGSAASKRGGPRRVGAIRHPTRPD
mmetsp:Transcript_16722/g.38598  ORF Transcript_16722/g.38598 Transcript_16722/m.38598 type:complete len:315 (-) Transcript_16722:122-1066(-)